MNCNICIIALSLFIVLIIIFFRKDKWIDFINKLDTKQKKTIIQIIKNRIFIILVIFIISCVITYSLSLILPSKNIMNTVCFYIVNITILTYLGYLLFPKDNFIELHLTTPQLNQWIVINDFNQFLILSGLLIGFLIFFFTGIFKKMFGNSK